MRASKQNILKTTSIATVLLFVLLAEAYSPHYTHPDLTEEMVEFYNSSPTGTKIGDEFISAMRRGSIDEDIAPRWINHFYDPQSGEGWTGEHLGPYDKEKVLWASDMLLAMNFTPMPAPEWAVSQDAQNLFISYGWNHTWQKAIYDYVNGREEKAFESLGYVLHLIEDMSVPDHTRNDSHPHVFGDPGSPYEDWVKDYTNSHKLDTAESLIKNGETIPAFSSPKEAFDYVARYSNENFVSEETINDKKYSSPRVIEFKTINNFTYAYGLTYNGAKIILYKFPNQDEAKATSKDAEILSAYFYHLSRRSVLAGAGVIDLFFREAEKAKQNQNLLESPPPPPNSLGTLGTLFMTRVVSPVGEATKIWEPIAETISATQNWLGEQRAKFKETVFNAAGVLYGSSVTLSDLEEDDGAAVSQSQPPTAEEATQPAPTDSTGANQTSESSAASANREATASDAGREAVRENTGRESVTDNTSLSSAEHDGSDAVSEESVPPPPIPDSAISNGGPGGGAVGGFSGGVSAPGAGAAPSISENRQDVKVQPSALADQTPPEAPVITVPAEDGLVFTSASITFSGTAEAGAVITTGVSSATTTVSNSGAWSLTIDSFPQGTTTAEFFAEDETGNLSQAGARAVFVDSVSPSVTIAVSECGQSLIPETEGCLVAADTLTLEWSSSDDDIDYYQIECQSGGASCAGFDSSQTTATTTTYAVPGDATYIFTARAVDRYGNENISQPETAEVVARPVIINEVAWMGTATSSYDEWLELKNMTQKTIALSGWTLEALDGTPSISLSGSIPAGGYFLLERKDDFTVSDVSADIIYGNDGSDWALHNNGEVLQLKRGNAIIDQTPDSCSGWCAGVNTGYNVTKKTMERVDPYAAGTESANWATALDEFVINGKDAAGNPINGTPKKRNSANYLISPSGGLTENKTLTKENSPYLISRYGLTVYSGATLTINPGVVTKFVSNNEPSLIVNGTINANGTQAEPVVFTSFYDDDYGGDMNGDGICDPGNASSTAACPGPGGWKQISINSSSAGSSFDYTLFRYGGRWFTNMSFRTMVFVSGTSATFRNSTFEYSMKHGLYLNSSNSHVQGSAFRYNDDTGDPIEDDSSDSGMFINGGSPTVQQNTFQNNIIGLQLAGSSATVSSNTFTNNSSYAVNSSGQIGAFTQNSGSGNGKNGILLSGQLAATGATSTLEANSIPYITGGTLPVGAGLIVNSGVEFRGESNQALIIDGTMVLGGTNKGDIIFTSLNDSAAGEWGGIVVNAGGFVSGGGFTLRYGGGSPSACFSSCAGFKINGGRVELTNGRIEKNFTAGMRIFNNASTTLSNFEFNDNTTLTYGSQTFDGTGLVLSGAGVVLNSVSFTGNTLGISSTGSTVTATGVTFTNNTTNTSPPDLIP